MTRLIVKRRSVKGRTFGASTESPSKDVMETVRVVLSAVPAVTPSLREEKIICFRIKVICHVYCLLMFGGHRNVGKCAAHNNQYHAYTFSDQYQASVP